MSDNDHTHRVQNAPHRRSTDNPGPAEVYEVGDPITPTESELRLAPDRFERIDTADEAESDEDAESGDESASEDDGSEASGDDEDAEETGVTAADVDDMGYQDLRSLAGDYEDVNGNWGEDRLRTELKARVEG